MKDEDVLEVTLRSTVSAIFQTHFQSLFEKNQAVLKKDISISAAGLEIVLQRPLWGQLKDAISQEKKSIIQSLKV